MKQKPATATWAIELVHGHCTNAILTNLDHSMELDSSSRRAERKSEKIINVRGAPVDTRELKLYVA